MERKQIETMIDDFAERAKRLVAQVDASRRQAKLSLADFLRSKQGSLSHVTQKLEHRVDESADHAAHRVEQLATHVTHTAREAAQQAAHVAKETADKLEHRSRELTDKLADRES